MKRKKECFRTVYRFNWTGIYPLSFDESYINERLISKRNESTKTSVYSIWTVLVQRTHIRISTFIDHWRNNNKKNQNHTLARDHSHPKNYTRTDNAHIHTINDNKQK